jgi:hypothetical protein
MSQDTLGRLGQAGLGFGRKGRWGPILTFRIGVILGAVALLLGLASCTGGGTIPGGGSHGGHTPPPVSKLDNWIMFAHDPQHTSASAASINGGLKQVWRYNPIPLAGNTFGGMYNAIATTTSVYTRWSQFGTHVFDGGPSSDGLTTSGALMWDYVEHRDFEEGHWLSAFSGGVVFQDDGEPLIDVGTGKLKKWLASSFDVWGETITDPSGFYGVNTFLADGPDLFVYQINNSGAFGWKALQQKSVKYAMDSVGALALSNGTLFYAASYSDPSPNTSGVYAINAAIGAVTGHVLTTPSSPMSADSSNIYLLENSSLVARSQATLAQVWSASLPFGMIGPPVIANGMVIVANFNGVEAHDQATGKLLWTSKVQPSGNGQQPTAMCAALVSNTLVVTSFDGIHLLKLSDGSEIWHGGPTGTGNPIIVNDPAVGVTVYVTDANGVIAMVPI